MERSQIEKTCLEAVLSCAPGVVTDFSKLFLQAGTVHIRSLLWLTYKGKKVELFIRKTEILPSQMEMHPLGMMSAF